MKMATISPMMQQYLNIKNEYKDSILFFRLGDFYEMFFEDAKLVSDELDLTLTGKDYGQKERAPMCGIPYHSCESYIARLVEKGYKVAMCDQIENPASAKGLVKREVVRVITPGTVTDESMLDASRNNYICSVLLNENQKNIGLCFCDISTGELKCTSIDELSEDAFETLKIEIGKFYPKEIIVGGKIELFSCLKNFIKDKLSCSVEILSEDVSFEDSKLYMMKYFKSSKIERFDFTGQKSTVISIGNLFSYLKCTQISGLERINSFSFYKKSEYMGIDLNTIRNLEIIETMRTKQKKGSLLWVIDKTKTAMGKRLMRLWIKRPLLDVSKIIRRQDSVEEIANNVVMCRELGELLSGIRDMERIMTKITYGSANAKDLKMLSVTLSKLPEIKRELLKCKTQFLKKLCDNLNLLKNIYTHIEDAIVDEPPLTLREGGIIKKGYNEELDKIRNDRDNGGDLIADIEKRERERTGISKLKIKYTKIFGYCIEITNSFADKVPDDYIRKQTLSNCERYITEELKEVETRVLHAKDKINEMEYRLFNQIRLEIADHLPEIVKTASVIARLDVIRSLAEVASENNYVKPNVNDGNTISICQGRHPVVELLAKDSLFVPNDTLLDNKENMVSIITGPNMAGKSTYMRQTAIIVLLAQIGSFVPATKADIGLVDNIFTRIGASDDLSSGQSTFMVEMNEVSDILRNATSNSLLILDEIGRGTSTFDGMSIARAVLEYVADPRTLGAKTLFATHYHELTDVVKEFKNIKNYSIAVKKHGDEITFLRKIIPGAADDSYGIEVAKLAGLPDDIILNAKKILKRIESEGLNSGCKGISANHSDVHQISFSENKANPIAQEICERLKNIDVSVLTPIEAMNILYELVNKVEVQ